MDTAKAANLFANYPEADLYEFINAPIGRGTPINKKLSPLIASEWPVSDHHESVTHAMRSPYYRWHGF